MTRRERLERRAERRREWAESRARKSAAGFERARVVADGIPFGQPILVGHHSEKRHRADIARIDAGMRAGVESQQMANEHTSKAAGIEDQLAGSIFSDDADAVEQLEAKAAAIEAECERKKQVNAAYRKARRTETGPDPDLRALHTITEAGHLTPDQALDVAKLWRLCPYHSGTPYPSYSITNARANARRCRERIKTVRAQQAQAAKVEAAGGVLIEHRQDPCWNCRGKHAAAPDPDGRPCYICKGAGVGELYARITFPDYPGRDVVEELKAAGFHWSRPSWNGLAAKIPARVVELAAAVDVSGVKS